MPPRAPFAVLLAIAAFASFAAPDLARATEQEERISAAFALALGRLPTPAESEEWLALGPITVDDLIGRVGARVAEEPEARRAAFAAAFHDAFGRAPVGEDSDAPGGGNYIDRLRGFIEQLSRSPEQYAEAIGRAYQFVIRRDAYPEEIDYWKEKGVLPYALLVGCLEDWAKRNQPGLMVTNGAATVSVNSQYLAAARLSPRVAAEARAAAGLPPPDDSGNRVVAAGAGAVASVGGVHFVAVGGLSREE